MKTHLLPSEHAILDDFSQGKVTNGSQVDPNLQKVMANQMEFEQGLLLEREQRIQNIESCILDVNQIMNELGAMVHQQADDISELNYVFLIEKQNNCYVFSFSFIYLDIIKA